MCNVLQNEQNITFSEVNVTCVSPVPLFIFPTHAKMRRDMVFSKVKAACVSSHVSSHSQPIPRCSRYCLFQVNAARVAFLVFLHSLLHGGGMESPVFFQFHLSMVMECPVFFQFHLSIPVPFQFLLQFLFQFLSNFPFCGFLMFPQKVRPHMCTLTSSYGKCKGRCLI